MENYPNKKRHNCFPRAAFSNLFITAAVLALHTLMTGPKISILPNTAVVVSSIMLVLYAAIACWSAITIINARKNITPVIDGPYALSRNPVCAATIFILNPAIGVLFRSWFLILAVIPVYFLWRRCVRAEENKRTPAELDVVRAEYIKKTPRFFPNLRSISPFLFYGTTGILIFLISFVCLNFNAFYLRWVIWETNGQIIYDAPDNISNSSFSQPNNLPAQETQTPAQKANYHPGPNSIIVSKLNINAPLVQPAGSGQNEINTALNHGVVLYPGSTLPGQAGEVFLTGHSSVFPWNKTQYGQVFTMLDKLQTGDIVSLVYSNYQHDYRITRKEILNPDAVKISSANEPSLALMTCWPIGTALKRLVVYGELIE